MAAAAATAAAAARQPLSADVVARLGCGGAINAITISPDRQFVLLGGRDGTLGRTHATIIRTG